MYKLTAHRNASPNNPIIIWHDDIPSLARALKSHDMADPIDDWELQAMNGATDYTHTRAVEQASGYFRRYDR